MSGRDLEVFKVLREAHDKYTYFILAATGAAITVALNRTQDASLEWAQLPLGAAVFAWGLSFYYGTRRLHYGHLALARNHDLLRVVAGEYPEVGNNPYGQQIARTAILEEMNKLGRRGNRAERLQFAMLMIGALSYIIWHIFEMYLRTIHA
jgi:hypothetical protein